MKLNLSKKIILMMTAFSVIIISSLSAISIVLSRNTTTQEVRSAITQFADEGAAHLRTRLDMNLSVMESLTADPQVISMDMDVQREFLRDKVSELGYLDIGIVTLDGQSHYVMEDTVADLSTRAYIKDALSGKTAVSDVLLSKVTNNMVIMEAAPIFDDNKVVGALIGRREAQYLSDFTNRLQFGSDGYAFILGENGAFFSHPDIEVVTSQIKIYDDIENDGPFKEFATKLQDLGEDKHNILTYQYEGISRFTAISPVPGTTWLLCVGTPTASVLSGITKLTYLLVILGAIFLILGVIIYAFVGKWIASPIEHLSRALTGFSNYDLVLTTDDPVHRYTKRSDEIGVITKALLSMKDNFTTLLSDISSNAVMLTGSAEELSDTSKRTAGTAEEISRAIEEISRGAQEQAGETEKGAFAVNEISQHLENNRNGIDLLYQSANHVNQLRTQGDDSIDKLMSASSQTNTAIDDIEKIILQTNAGTEKISSVSSMIQNIANQTNLLALNAAIEAARAGDSGRGFAVVADEIRKLAEQSSTFASEITETIAELSRISAEAVNSSKIVRQQSVTQQEGIQDTKEKFSDISRDINRIHGDISSLESAAVQLDINKNEVIETMHNLSAISEEYASSTEQTSASIQEQTASIALMAEEAEKLSHIAQNLKENISKFRY